MTQQQLAFIKSKCIAANKSILDLVFGCELKRNDQYGTVYKCVNEHGFACNDEKVWLNSVPFGVMEVERIRIGKDLDFEIIGRPIQLPDVLLAIGKKKESDDDYNPILVSETGSFFLHDMDSSDIEGYELDHLAFWNLLLPLDGQEEVTIKFLYELLYE